jgi:methylene-tetrahydromethanopterin dehydrogenase
VGALAIGNVKYQLQQTLLQTLLQTEQPVFLDFREAFVKARNLV